MIKQKLLLCSALFILSVAGMAAAQSPTPSPTPAPTPTPTPKECDVPVSREVDTNASIQAKPEPKFTEAERKQHRGAVITLSATFCGSGKVTDIKVTKGLTDRMEVAAVEAARLIQFTPAEKDGKKVSRGVTIKYIVKD